MLKQFDMVVLTQNTDHFRSGAQLMVLEDEDEKLGVKVGISPSDEGVWVSPNILQKIC